MKSSFRYLMFGGAVSLLLLLGDGNPPPVMVVVPIGADSVSYDPGKLFIVSVAKDAGTQLTFSTQWEKIHEYDLSPSGAKENFPRDFYRFFDSRWTIESWSYSFKVFTGYTKPETLAYPYAEGVTIKTLWNRMELLDFVKKLQSSEASKVVVQARGWQDTVLQPVYDDPSNENRTLYKLHGHLIAGPNTVWFTPGADRTKGMSHTTSLVFESKPAPDRADRFHNSTLEQSCSTCHEGLPSAMSADSMKADCAVCHKAKYTAPYLHAPAEMKECTTCHSWSKQANAVTVAKGVPAVCYDCHDDKQKQVDSSTVQHPVAGDCLTCHSPHASGNKHLVKSAVFTLCTSCHEDAKLNHPVGRHPVRFAKLENGDEISCVSCHNPHGSPYKYLLKKSDEPMEVCADCHSK